MIKNDKRIIIATLLVCDEVGRMEAGQLLEQLSDVWQTFGFGLSQSRPRLVVSSLVSRSSQDWSVLQLSHSSGWNHYVTSLNRRIFAHLQLDFLWILVQHMSKESGRTHQRDIDICVDMPWHAMTSSMCWELQACRRTFRRQPACSSQAHHHNM